jgi:hypothetical protein
MELLPPVGWVDVATKRDLDQLTEHFEMKFDRIDDRFDRIDDRFRLIDERFDRIDDRFRLIDERFERMDERFGERFERTDERFALLLNARTAEQRADTAQLRADFEGSLRRMQTVLLSAFMTLAGVLIVLSIFGPS